MSEILPVTKSAEWYTPPKYTEAARLVMGSIELDPASCAAANQIVKADRYYTKEQNGLDQDWQARTLWLNPPYGRTAKMQATRKSTIGLFIEKLLQSYEQGKVHQAIALVTTEVNAKWFYPLWQFPICIPDHRVTFLVPHKTANNYKQMFGTCFVYLGPNTQRFIEVFSQFGVVVEHVSPIKQTYSTLKMWDVTINSTEEVGGAA